MKKLRALKFIFGKSKQQKLNPKHKPEPLQLTLAESKKLFEFDEAKVSLTLIKTHMTHLLDAISKYSNSLNFISKEFKLMARNDGSNNLAHIDCTSRFSLKLGELPPKLLDIKKSFEQWLLEVKATKKKGKKVREFNKKYQHYDEKLVKLETEKDKLEQKSKFTKKNQERITRNQAKLEKAKNSFVERSRLYMEEVDAALEKKTHVLNPHIDQINRVMCEGAKGLIECFDAGVGVGDGGGRGGRGQFLRAGSMEGVGSRNFDEMMVC
jgi:hypothetical protein